jgi:hypothetical protein
VYPAPPQVSKHVVEPQSDVPSNIFTKEPTGSNFFDEPLNFWPEVTVILRASALPGCTERLARVSGGNKVNCSIWSNNSVLLQSLCRERAYVVVNWPTGEVLADHSLWERLTLTEGNRYDSGPMCGEVNSAYAAE